MKVKFMSFLTSLTLLLCFGTMVLPAHLSAQKTVEFGAGAAFDLGIFKNSSPYDMQARPQAGYSVQGMSSLKLGSRLRIQAGLGYAFRPFHAQLNSMVLSTDIDASLTVISHSTVVFSGHLHELHVPVLLKAHLKQSQRGLYAGVGPLIGIIFRSRIQTTVYRGNGNVENMDYAYGRNEPRLALQACVGHRFALTPGLDLGMEVYGNADAGTFFLMPVKPFTAGARVVAWL